MNVAAHWKIFPLIIWLQICWKMYIKEKKKRNFWQSSYASHFNLKDFGLSWLLVKFQSYPSYQKVEMYVFMTILPAFQAQWLSHLLKYCRGPSTRKQNLFWSFCASQIANRYPFNITEWNQEFHLYWFDRSRRTYPLSICIS